MSNLFEEHKYRYTIPQDTIRAMRRKIDELEEEIDDLRYRLAVYEDPGDLFVEPPDGNR